MGKKTSETAQTLPVMKAVNADPASMAKSELARLREENRRLQALIAEYGSDLLKHKVGS